MNQITGMEHAVCGAALPPQTEALLKGFAEDSKALLRDNLVGVYLHGSAVMGCFNPETSDVDLIIVAERPLSDPVKRASMDMVVRYNALAPAKGIEMSIVLRRFCNPFVYPTPFELHFSAGYLDWYQEDPDDYLREMTGEDKDLAAHFTIINRRGKCLCGAPIEAVFGEVPPEDYMDSLWFDVEGAPEEITAYPMYLTLNLARVLAFREEGLVLSKREGGEWALRNLPAEYRPLLTAALQAYAGDGELLCDEVLAKSYAAYVVKRIRLPSAGARQDRVLCETAAREDQDP